MSEVNEVPAIDGITVTLHRLDSGSVLLGVAMGFDDGVVLHGFCFPEELFMFLEMLVTYRENQQRGGDKDA